MKFENYLVEKKAKFDYNPAMDIIENECSKILDIYKKAGKPLFRSNWSSEYFVEKNKRSGVRKPRNIDIEIHRFLNKLFKEKFGWNVRDGIFASSEYSSQIYGNQYYFFPVNKFKYAWSPKIEDLYLKMPMVPIGLKPKEVKEWLDKKTRSFKSIVNSYKDNDIETLIKSGWMEISFNTPKCYLLSISVPEKAIKERGWW